MSSPADARTPSSARFDRDVAGARVDDRHTVELSDGWRVGGGLNGGYLLAVIGHACAEVAAEHGHPDPFVVTAHYLSAARPGPAVVRTDLVRSGGRDRKSVV